MDLQEKINNIIETLQAELDELSPEVDEAYDDQEKMYLGEYDFGHSQDSFDAGWDRGMTVGHCNSLSETIDKLKKL